jgi:tripartite-type tricarboxylate transporter receptor subunit TctC
MVPELKDIPASVEKGINFTQGSWRGFAIKKGVPEDVKAILIDVLQKAYDDPKYKAMEENEMTNVRPGYLKAEEYGKSWDEEFDSYVEVFKAMGIIQ